MSLDVKRIRALCFDVDGTLRDTDDQYVLKIAQILRPVRRLFYKQDPLLFARWLVMKTEAPGNFIYGLPDFWRIDGPLNDLREWLKRFGATRKFEPSLLIEGVAGLLEGLVLRYPMAIVSARDEESTLSFLKEHRLSDFFTAVATAQTCRHTKPYPDPILWAAERLGCTPGECLMIGDTPIDIRAGRAAGAQTVGVLCGFGSEPDLRRSGAHLILPSTPGLAAFLTET